MKPETITKQIFKIIPALLLVALSAFLLQGDVWTFWTWYLLALVMGVAAMPLTGRLFRRFQDRGWMFSKVTAIAVSGFLTWFLVAVKIIKFTTGTCIVVTLVCAAASLILYCREQKAGFECIPFVHLDLVYAEELLFFCGISSLDLFCGLPSGGIWYRKVYGLWFHGGHDAEQNTAGDRPLVFTGEN